MDSLGIEKRKITHPVEAEAIIDSILWTCCFSYHLFIEHLKCNLWLYVSVAIREAFL